jgi:hypothetical protein
MADQAKGILDYFKPRSLTFWSGAFLIVTGVLEATGKSIPGLTAYVGPIVDAYFGTTGAAAKISLGLGLIGLRRRLTDA